MLWRIAQASGACSKSPAANALSMRHPEIVNTELFTIDRMTTQGRLRERMMAIAKDVLPEPELPATPIMLVFAHGGE